MQTQKLLIAESSDELRQTLTDLLGERYHICTCRSGDKALALLRSFAPDVIYIDLMLPQIDGIAVLQTAAQEGIRPTVLAAIGFESPYITAALSRLQVDYVVKKPCAAKTIASHIDELSGIISCIPAPKTDLQTATAALLMQLGFQPGLDGFQYVVSGMPMFAENTQQALTKVLYPAIAKLYGKTGSRVERSIRNAINKAWQRRNEQLWRMYFSPAPDGSVPRPTNGQLLHILFRTLCAQQEEWESA